MHTYRIKRGDGDFGTEYRTSYELHLRYELEPGRDAVFDPRDGAPGEAAGFFPAPTGESRLFLVQYHTHPLPEYRRAAAASGYGIRPVRLLSGNTEVVLVESGDGLQWLEQQRAQNGYVRALLPFLPEYRLEPDLFRNLRDGRLERDTFTIEVLDSGPRMKARVLTRILEDLGGIVELTPPSGKLLRATLTPEQLLRVCTWPEVVSVEVHVQPRNHVPASRSAFPPPAPTDGVRKDGGANFLEGECIDGAGVKVEVLDSGIREDHPQLPGVHLNVVDQPHDRYHGTSVAGIVGAVQEPKGTAKGVLQNCTLLFSSTQGVKDRMQHTQELVEAGCVLQTNSWGLKSSEYSSEYSSATAELDEIALDNDLLVLHSMGLVDRKLFDELAHAKNVLSIGAVFTGGMMDPDDHVALLSKGGTEGPTCTGDTPSAQIKPDLCYWYDLVQTTTVEDDVLGWGEFSGTSASTPSVAGYAGLVYALWHSGTFGHEFPSGESVADHAPHPATVRALLVNSANGYDLQKIARHQQGWGRPNVQNLYERASMIFVVDESVALEEEEKVAWTGPFLPSDGGLRVTLVYEDLASASVDGPATLQSDLALEVVAPDDATIYRGNHGLCQASESGPGGVNDAFNPIENVFLSQSTAEAHGEGDWTVRVHALKALMPYGEEVDLSVLPEVRFALVISGLEDPVLEE